MLTYDPRALIGYERLTPEERRVMALRTVSNSDMENYFRTPADASNAEKRNQQKKMLTYYQRMKQQVATTPDAVFGPGEKSRLMKDWTFKPKTVRMGGSPFAQTEVGQRLAGQTENINALGDTLAGRLGTQYEPTLPPDTSTMDMRDMGHTQRILNTQQEEMRRRLKQLLGLAGGEL